MVRRACVLALAVGLVATTSCRVAEIDKDTPEVCSGGAVIKSRSYANADTEAYPVPLPAHEGKRLRRRNSAGGSWLLTGRGWPLGPITQPRFEDRDEENGVAFQGPNDRLWSLATSPDVLWPTRIGLFGLSGVAGTLGSYSGKELEFSYGRPFDLGGFDLIPSAGMRWRNQDLVDYSYGMRPIEARADRPACEGENGFDPFVRLALRHQIIEGWSLLAAAQYEWLDNQTAGNFIVDADHDALLMVGMLYEW